MTYRPTPRQLEYFLAVAETGHFGEAAKRCYVSQPSLSTQLKLLEEQLGGALIQRGNSPVKPTALGEKLLPMAREVLNSLDGLVASAKTPHETLSGTVKLGVASTFGPYFLPQFLHYLRSSNPDLKLSVREEDPEGLQEELSRGQHDCLLIPVYILDEKMEAVTFCREEVLLGVPASCPLADLKEVRLPALEGQTLLTLGPTYRMFDVVMAVIKATGSEPKVDYEAHSLDGLRRMVALGMGISLFPATYVNSEMLRDPDVEIKRIVDFSISRRLCIAWRRGSADAQYYRMLARLAHDTLMELDIPDVDPVWVEFPEPDNLSPPEKVQ